jgi:hypothetical protein
LSTYTQFLLRNFSNDWISIPKLLHDLYFLNRFTIFYELQHKGNHFLSITNHYEHFIFKMQYCEKQTRKCTVYFLTVPKLKSDILECIQNKNFFLSLRSIY